MHKGFHRNKKTLNAYFGGFGVRKVKVLHSFVSPFDKNLQQNYRIVNCRER